MKKIILLIILVGIFVFWYTKKDPVSVVPSDTLNYRNASLGISFTYPKILTASTTSDKVTLHHEVPFVHHDYCDFKGEVDTTIDTLTDFHLAMHISNKSLVDTMKTESPYIPQENFVNNEVVPSPGFIDEFQVGEYSGFKIFEGAEGCGHTKYYLSVSKNKTLVMEELWVTVFSGVIDVENKSKAEAVPGVINKERSEEIISSIFGSLSVE